MLEQWLLLQRCPLDDLPPLLQFEEERVVDALRAKETLIAAQLAAIVLVDDVNQRARALAALLTEHFGERGKYCALCRYRLC